MCHSRYFSYPLPITNPPLLRIQRQPWPDSTLSHPPVNRLLYSTATCHLAGRTVRKIEALYRKADMMENDVGRQAKLLKSWRWRQHIPAKRWARTYRETRRHISKDSIISSKPLSGPTIGHVRTKFGGHYVWFWATAAKQIRNPLFWAITRRVAAIPYRRFGATYRSHLQGLILKDGTPQFVRNVAQEILLLDA
jgi:hypothetical protein